VALTTPAVVQFVVATKTSPASPAVFKDIAVPGEQGAYTRSATTADLDSDGDMDIITAGGLGMNWFENQGHGTFVARELNQDSGFATDTQVMDMDADGDMDIVINGLFNIFLYKNDGNQNFTLGQLTTTDNQVDGLALADFDGNGLPDVVYSNYSAHEVYILYNKGALVFQSATISNTHLFKCQVADVEHDGDLDIISHDESIMYCILNTGGGTFQTQTILNGNGIADFTAADFDGDGDIDLTTQETDVINLYLQNGGLQFSKQTLPNLTPGYQHLTTPADYDGDHDIDLLLLGYYEVNIMENDGHANFAQRESVHLQYPYSNNIERAGDADLDNDGDLDFFGVGGYGLTLFKNTTLGEAFPFAEQPFPGFVALTSGDSDWADYDNDGDLDLLATGDSNGQPKTILYENQNGTLVIKPTGMMNVNLGSCDWGDYDRDGDLDILLMGLTEYDIDHRKSATAIYTNTNGNFALLPSSQTQLPQTYYGEARWADLDNDGWLDIAMNAMAETITGAGSALYRSDGQGNFEKKFDLPFVYTDANLATADYDNDGDMDVVVSGWRGNDDLGALLKVYRNDGGWTFAEAAGNFEGFIGGDLNWADMDADGDLDLIASGDRRGSWTSLPTTRVYENKDGVFASVENNSFLYRPSGSGSAVTGDFDNDGMTDVATSNGTYDGGLDVFLNKGINSLTDMQIELAYPGSHYLDAVDFDNDNDLDLALEAKLVVNNVDKKNTPPAPPTQLRDSVYNNILYLYWQNGSDAETPTAALSYQIYAGTKAKTQDIINANAGLSDGQRRTVDLGAAKGKVWKITGLSGGPVHWSVQTIDAAFRGSAFAAETQAQFIKLNGPDKVCLESTYTYTAEPTGSYTWKIKGGTILSGQGTDNISVRWDLPGDAWLAASNSSSKKNTLHIVVDKMPTPVIAGNNQVCTGVESYAVADLLAAHHQWTVGGGEISGGQNTATVSVTWNTPGANKLTDEIASENFGCITTIALVVDVDQRPAPVIVGPPIVCATRAIVYTTEAIHPDWNVTGGTFPPDPGQSMTVTWQAEKGDGKIDLTEVSQNGFCSTSVSLPIKINPLPSKPTIEFAANKLKSTTAAQYQWYINDVAISATANGTAREITVGKSGSYRVEVTNLVGCSISSDPFLVTDADAEINDRLILYPNPARNNFILQTGGTTHYPATVSILDVSGRIVKQLTVHQEITEVDIQDLSFGYYTLTVHDATSFHYLRLAKY
jgi:hypothetical protein